MEINHVVITVIGCILIVVGLIVFNSLGKTIETLRIKLKEQEALAYREKQLNLSHAGTLKTLREDVSTAEKQYNDIRNRNNRLIQALKILVDNPIRCIKVMNGEDNFKEVSTPTLRLAAKGEAVNYSAFMYNGGADVTDKVILVVSDTETLEDLLENL